MLANAPKVFGAAHEAMVNNHLSWFFVIILDAGKSDWISEAFDQELHRLIVFDEMIANLKDWKDLYRLYCLIICTLISLSFYLLLIFLSFISPYYWSHFVHQIDPSARENKNPYFLIFDHIFNRIISTTLLTNRFPYFSLFISGRNIYVKFETIRCRKALPRNNLSK